MYRVALITLAALVLAPPAFSMETSAKQAILVDYDTGTVMLAKEAETPMPPSSMSKLMTSYVLDQRIKEGRVKLDDTFKVSEKAWRMQGSKMFVHVGDTVPVEDLIRGIIVQSGNDACVTVAEGISGTEDAFAEEMNRVAKDIGLEKSHFANATGWPDEKHVMTAKDLSTLAARIIKDFPERYHYYSEKEFKYNNITQPNRNRLLGNDIGVDGMKTGHTEAGGYGIVLSAKDPKSQRRLILVINGLENDNARMEEGDRLLRFGFREYENKTIAKAGEVIDSAPVWLGSKESVALTVEKDAVVTMPIVAQDKFEFVLRSPKAIPAPIAKGAHVADLVIKAPNAEPIVVPLVAAEEVGKRNFFGRIIPAIKYHLLGKE